MEAFASPATEKCMKSLQAGKLVLLCIQSEKTKSNDEAMKGVKEFKEDERFGNATTVISIDPMDKKEASFLADLQVPTETTEAVTVVLAPPGRAIAKYQAHQQGHFGGYARQGQRGLPPKRLLLRRLLSAEMKPTNLAYCLHTATRTSF